MAAAVPPPSKGSLVARGRRRLRSLAGLNRPRYWLVTRAVWVLLAVAILFALDGCLIGWSVAYEVLIGIKSPAEVGYAPVSWAVSLVGWLIVPAFVGGLVGYLVTRQIDARRTESEADVLQDLRKRARANRSAGRGGRS
ncbi:DUF6313 family protein [Nonomuraea sp. M3C6]|uniref:DUF6313 family protein n=1 Tax=Nonomuraea marmarensis TaxID=3351344 RepID=A0ABW7AUE7_9ACTN